MLEPEQRAWLNAYHARVLETLRSRLNCDTIEWLEAQTAAI